MLTTSFTKRYSYFLSTQKIKRKPQYFCTQYPGYKTKGDEIIDRPTLIVSIKSYKVPPNLY
jgi:hypothetical protein